MTAWVRIIKNKQQPLEVARTALYSFALPLFIRGIKDSSKTLTAFVNKWASLTQFLY